MENYFPMKNRKKKDEKETLHKKLYKVFKHLRYEDHFFKSFKEVRSFNGLFCFEGVLDESLNIGHGIDKVNFYFMKNTFHADSCSLNHDKSSTKQKHYLVGYEVSFETIYSEILNNLKGLQKGMKNEELFFERVLTLSKVPSSKIVGIKKSSNKVDCIEHIDFFIEYKNSLGKIIEIPINVKSSYAYVKKHKKEHPNVATISYNAKMTDKKLRKILNEICESFI